MHSIGQTTSLCRKQRAPLYMPSVMTKLSSWLPSLFERILRQLSPALGLPSYASMCSIALRIHCSVKQTGT